MKYTSHKKIIPYHAIINLQKDFERFNSFDESFHWLLAYFSLAQTSASKENSATYDTNQLILADLYQEYQELSAKFQQELWALKKSPGIKPKQIER